MNYLTYILNRAKLRIYTQKALDEICRLALYTVITTPHQIAGSVTCVHLTPNVVESSMPRTRVEPVFSTDDLRKFRQTHYQDVSETTRKLVTSFGVVHVDI